MKVFDTGILDVKIIEPTVYEDERGYFFEAYNAQKFEELMGFCPNFCQSNESFSKKGTIRGLHLQQEPYAQGKLVRVVAGEILDVAVDCRPNSGSFGKHVAVELSGENRKQLWIPKGFAHGFQVLSDECLLNYCVDCTRKASAEIEINCFDEYLAIDWNVEIEKIMSEKDQAAKSFSEVLGLFDHVK